MKRSALGYNFYINPFSSRAADVFHHFAYIISATIVLPVHVERYAWQQNIIVSLTLTVLMYYMTICIPYLPYSTMIMSLIMQSIASSIM